MWKKSSEVAGSLLCFTASQWEHFCLSLLVSHWLFIWLTLKGLWWCPNLL